MDTQGFLLTRHWRDTDAGDSPARRPAAEKLPSRTVATSNSIA